MKRFDVILIFIAFTLSTTVLFQNCSEMKAADPSLYSNQLDTSLTPRSVPDFISNRSLSLDNKVYSSTSFSVGGSDKIYYETDYLAVYESTLVTIKEENSEVILEVESDDCQGSKVFNAQDINDLFSIYANSENEAQQNSLSQGEVIANGCSFPRLVVDSSNSTDIEIYFSSKACTPDSELYIPANANIDPNILLNDIESFFKAQIDQVCGN